MAYLHLSQANSEIISNPLGFWASKTSAERRAFAGMVDYDNRFKDITPTQTKIGSLGGAALSTGKRWLDGWKKNGIVESQHRKSHKKNISKSCRYSLHPSYRDSRVREQLSKLPEFALVFKMSPIKKMVVPPYHGRRKHNINILLSAPIDINKETTNLANLNYELPIKNNVLLGIKQLNQSPRFEASQTCQTEKSSQSSSTLPGYRFDMTKEEKIAYALARSAEVASQKKEQPQSQTMPSGLSSYEQGQYLKQQLSTEQRKALEKLSRERLESGYVDEFDDWREKERKKRTGSKTAYTTRESVMYNFSEEELLELSKYPKQAIEHANKQMTNMLHQGKSISYPFKWLLAVCDRWVADQNKTPKTGKTMASVGKPRPSNFTEYVAGGKWVPGAEIINTPNTFQSSITHVETEIEWAMNYEQSIHQRTQLDPVFAKQTARFDKNPIWSKLNEKQRTDIWSAAHGNDCSCRKNEDAGLIMPQVATKLVARFM